MPIKPEMSIRHGSEDIKHATEHMSLMLKERSGIEI